MADGKTRKKDSARLTWDNKPGRAPNPRDIEFQTAEVVIPNPHREEVQLSLSFRDGAEKLTERFGVTPAATQSLCKAIPEEDLFQHRSF